MPETCRSKYGRSAKPKSRRPRSRIRRKIRLRRMTKLLVENQIGRRAATRSTRVNSMRRSHPPRVARCKKSVRQQAKESSGAAYFKRAAALTRSPAIRFGARRLSPGFEIRSVERRSKRWIDKIIMIYESINRGYPKEGEEPPPLAV